MEDLRTVTPVVSLKVFEAHEKKDRVYRAIPVRPVFDKISARIGRQRKKSHLTSIDGYQPSIPVAKFLAHDAYARLRA